MINKESKQNKYPQCLEEEDCEHVLLCIANEEIHKELLFCLQERLIESEAVD